MAIKQSSATVVSNQEIMPGVYLLWVEAPEIASEASPGQFVMVRCGNNYDPLLCRPLSIHRLAPDKDGGCQSSLLALLFTIIGKGTRWLSACQKGTKFNLVGPLGNGFSIKPDSKNLLLIAGGMGIAPLVFLAERALSQGLFVTLLLGVATASQLYPRSLLPEKLRLFMATEDGSSGEKGMITNLALDFFPTSDQVFACGPLNMYRTLSEQIRDERIDKIQISLEARMGCGIGVCYGCSLKTKQGLKQVCRDGPVFELREILWPEVEALW